ncbi:MAG: radical SAM protein [Verrucomicrobiota bacterium]|nr:radical SAM protein [Verrucomicrobiota bacterium]
MRITLVHPAGFNFVPGQPDFAVLANRMAPLGILSLAAWLEKYGHPTAVHDCLGPNAPRGLEANAEQILQTNPELVGISATTCAFLEGADLAAILRARRPGLKLVFGNAHVSALGGVLLRHFPEIDYLCMGEGEGPLLDLAEGKAPAEIPNLVWRDGDRIRTNPRRPRIQNLDDLPLPAYEKLEGFPQGYHLPLFSYEKRWGATMVTSRGCPFTCSFCDRTVFERQYKTNSAAYIYENMKLLRNRFGVQHINFYDDLFTANEKRVTELCERLIREPLGMNFNCAVRTGQTSSEVLKLLKRAGAFMLSIGVESADPGMMKRHKAGVSLEGVRDTVDKIHAAGLRSKGLFIFGLPGETPETVRTTSDFILSLNLDDMNMTKFSPLYGAPLWDECACGQEGEMDEDWRLMNCLNFVYLPKGFESRAQMDELYNQHVRRFYGGKEYQRRFAKRLWQHRWSLWHMLRNAPRTIQAARYFSANRKLLEQAGKSFPPHPRQPRELKADLGSELREDMQASLAVEK